MRIKRDLNTRGVERIKGLTSLELAERCPDDRRVFPDSPCTNCGCEYAIGQPGYMNCTFVAAQVSEHTLEAIGEMMGITREGVRLIEIRALKKVRLAIELQEQTENGTTTLREQTASSGPDYFEARNQSAKRKNEPDLIPAING